jgi:hypothetical protein
LVPAGAERYRNLGVRRLGQVLDSWVAFGGDIIRLARDSALEPVDQWLIVVQVRGGDGTMDNLLLHDLDTSETPSCSACVKIMIIAVIEQLSGRPNFITFRCIDCGRTERFICR